MKLSCNFLWRKKDTNTIISEETKLARVLNTLDLTVLGIGSSFGTSIYIVIGSVIKHYAGPSVVFSCIIAALASLLSGMCYAELSSRIPKSGSAYFFIYVTIGEFFAFIIGWDMILEYMIGSASVASALSQYINAMTGHKISTYLTSIMPINVSGMSPYPDFLAFILAIIVAGILIIGVKESSHINRFLVVLNVAITIFIVVAGMFKVDKNMWTIPKHDIYSPNSTYAIEGHCVEEKNNCGDGGVLPYGAYGLFQGAAKCFYAFIGFDVIATTGEEVKNPRRALPLSIMLTLLSCTIAYVCVSVVISMMIPYFIMDANAPLASAFGYAQLTWAQYILSCGVIISLSSGLYSGMFPLPRIIYSMASDGLLHKSFSKVLPKIKTPALAIILVGFFTAALAAVFGLEHLVEMTAIGTLFAYTIVALCVLVLRYRPISGDIQETENERNSNLFKDLFIASSIKPTKYTSRIVNTFVFIAVLCVIGMDVLLTLTKHGFTYGIIIGLGVIGVFFILCIAIIYCQPQGPVNTFKIPFVPVVSLLSVMFNVYLMAALKLETWIRFLVWLALGALVYLSYGIRHSYENKKRVKSSKIDHRVSVALTTIPQADTTSEQRN